MKPPMEAVDRALIFSNLRYGGGDSRAAQLEAALAEAGASRTELVLTGGIFSDEASQARDGALGDLLRARGVARVTVLAAGGEEPRLQSAQAALRSSLGTALTEGDLHARRIAPGEDRAQEIDRNIQAADLILLLVSADFLSADSCYSIELAAAMQRHEAGLARVIPVILRPVDWQTASFGRLEPLPPDGRPVTVWENRDVAWLAIAQGIRKLAEARPRLR